MDRLADAAASLTDTIDRNLFERYGDVQAFGLNTVAHDPRHWRRPGAENPLVRAIDEYVAGSWRLQLVRAGEPGGRGAGGEQPRCR